MGRIERGYEAKFRAILNKASAGKIEHRVCRLLERSKSVAAAEGISPSQALARLARRLQQQIERWKKLTREGCRSSAVDMVSPPPHFLCDSGLGGLARWLHATGYEARWMPDIDDDELLREA